MLERGGDVGLHWVVVQTKNESQREGRQAGSQERLGFCRKNHPWGRGGIRRKDSMWQKRTNAQKTHAEGSICQTFGDPLLLRVGVDRNLDGEKKRYPGKNAKFRQQNGPKSSATANPGVLQSKAGGGERDRRKLDRWWGVDAQAWGQS